FLRRVCLDIAGHIPFVEEARTFLKDKKPDKRQHLVDELLKRNGYVNHFTNVWRALWMAEADTSFVGRYFVPGFENWLRQELGKNAGYDQIVREILTTSIAQNNNQFFDFYGTMRDPKPTGF